MRNTKYNTYIILGIFLMFLGAVVTVIAVCSFLSKSDIKEDVTPTPVVVVTSTPKPTPTKKPTVIWGDKEDVDVTGPDVNIDDSEGEKSNNDDNSEIGVDSERYEEYITVKPDGSIVIDFDQFTKDNFGNNFEETE